jgi:Toprim domain/CHC2 zinc finger
VTGLDAARSARIEDELSRRGIKLSVGTVERCGACPVCGGTDRFSINTKKQVWNCRGCAIGGDVIALVRHLDGLSFKEAVRLLTGHVPPQKSAHGGQGKFVGYIDRAEPKKAASGLLWKAIWAEARDPRRTLVDLYLQSRHLELPDEAAFEAIRFHPACPFGSDRFPAMICLVRNIITNEPQGVHRTALMPDGIAIKRDGKTLRMSLGPVSGGAIKIDADEDVAQGLCIAEGVETALAGRQMGLQPVWSLLSTAGIASFPMLSEIEGLHIFRENDANLAGAKACEACASRWRDAGRAVVIADPASGRDLNDDLRGAAA